MPRYSRSKRNHFVQPPVFLHSHCADTVVVHEFAPAPPQVLSTQIPTHIEPVESMSIVAPLPTTESVGEQPVVESILVPSSECGPRPQFTTPQCIAPRRFLTFPYDCGMSGIMARGMHKEWSGRLKYEFGSRFDGLNRQGIGFLSEHSSRLGFQFQWDTYVEDLGDGWTDELHLADVNVLFRVVESEKYLIRAGIGVNILGDAFGSDSGFTTTISAELFPVKPLVLSGELDLGTIGDAEMFHVMGKAGLMFNRFEVFGGYDYRTIGGVALQGPMVGLQVWF